MSKREELKQQCKKFDSNQLFFVVMSQNKVEEKKETKTNAHYLEILAEMNQAKEEKLCKTHYNLTLYYSKTCE